MSEAHSAVVAPKKRVSRIWIIPIIAALIGLWMIYKYLDDKGQIIYITMPNAEGISAGKTLIKTRSVPIGTVIEVNLAENLEQVVVAAEIEKPFVRLLKKDSLIWGVQPRIDESGISGLGTILSGIYFELQPGVSQSTATHFNLLDVPPLVSQNVKGRRFQLYSNSAEVLNVGAPVLFKGFKVGSIEKANFTWQSQTMSYQIFIEEPNYNLVTDNTLFWVESGIELDLSADGISFRTGSLSKLFGGAITFGVPEREPRGDRASENKKFLLSGSYKESLEERYTDFELYVVPIGESVRGLRPGAPVEYRGIRIGTVVEVPALIEQEGKPHFMTDSSTHISVLIKIEFQRIYRNTKLAREFWTGNIDQWIKDGLRISMHTGNLLTGGLYLEFNFHSDEEATHAEYIGEHKVIPGVTSGGLSQLSAQMSSFMNKLNRLEIEETLAKMETTLSSFSQLADESKTLLQHTNSQNIPEAINQSLQQLQSTLKDFQDGTPLYKDIQNSLRAIEQLSQDFQNGAPIYNDLRKTLNAIEQLSKELQPFSKSLNEHPNILIFDKAPENDVQPQRGNNSE